MRTFFEEGDLLVAEVQAFFADGTCGAKLPPIHGLDIPEWSLLWLAVLTVVAVLLSLRRA